MSLRVTTLFVVVSIDSKRTTILFGGSNLKADTQIAFPLGNKESHPILIQTHIRHEAVRFFFRVKVRVKGALRPFWINVQVAILRIRTLV